jgi:hypothetical protein
VGYKVFKSDGTRSELLGPPQPAGRVDVFNLGVPTSCSYFVGEAQLLVHNAKSTQSTTWPWPDDDDDD